MEIQKFKKLKDNRYKIILKNKQEFILYDDIILKYNLLLTKQISSFTLNKIIKENTSLECYYKAIKYITVKLRSEKEVTNYLKKYKYSMEDITSAILMLKEQKYLNEENYIASFITDQINLTNNGPEKIKNKLINLGFKDEEITPFLEKQSDDIWKEKLLKIITKKINANKKDSAKKLKERILYNCLNDGFKKSDIIDILKTVDIPCDKDLCLKEAEKLYQKLSNKYSDKELEYKLKTKLLTKGFDYSEIEEALSKIL